MDIKVLSKNIILFLISLAAALTILLYISSSQIERLTKANAALKEEIAMYEALQKESDVNIKALKAQVKETEKICLNRLKARADILHLTSCEKTPGAVSAAAPGHTKGANDVISKAKSDYAIDSINSYFNGLRSQTDNTAR